MNGIQSALRQLPEHLVNRIAAGEVIERPAAALKELVENSIDAGAQRIQITLRDGGKALLSVIDDGKGMSSEELPLSVERHVTSKMPGDDLTQINWLGFRGEALPAIGAVSRLSLTSRKKEADHAWKMEVVSGISGPVAPAALEFGTCIEVRDLFFSTPARLKFMKTERAEIMAAVDVNNQLSTPQPDVTFTLTSDGRTRLHYDAGQGQLMQTRLKRLTDVMGKDFTENAIPVEASRDGVSLAGYASLPTLNRGNARLQFVFVNGRPVRDKLINGAVRAAYPSIGSDQSETESSSDPIGLPFDLEGDAPSSPSSDLPFGLEEVPEAPADVGLMFGLEDSPEENPSSPLAFGLDYIPDDADE